MNAADFYKAGKLQDAIDAQLKEVKANPADQAKRLFLFELLAFTGDLERAQRQIEAVTYREMELDAAVMAYRKLLDAEQLRRRLFSDGLAPQLFGEAPEHVRLRLDSVNRLRENNSAEAAACLAQAAAATPAVRGELNGKPFESLRDCDDLFAAVLEVMAHGVYYWVPLEQIDTLSINAPKFPRDLLWIPARLETRDNPAGNVFLPALYPGSHEHADNQIKLGRMTDWLGSDGGPVRGVGLRTFLVDDDAVTLLEWRQLEVAKA
jgi:type VI secretion system protein ImpE